MDIKTKDTKLQEELEIGDLDTTSTSFGHASFVKEDSWSIERFHGFKIELSVSCRDIIDGDILTKSDPMVVMYVQSPISKIWREYGRTETIYNTLNADFVKKFVIDYYFEELQRLKFEVYDVDSKSPDLSKHQFLGKCFCLLGQIVRSKTRYKGGLSFDGTEKNGKGSIIISAEELKPFKETVYMQWEAKKLDKKDLLGKSDPFLVISRQNPDQSFTISHKSEVVKNTLKPTWRAMEIPVTTLCNGDYGRSLKVEVYDWNRAGKNELIGMFTTTLKEMLYESKRRYQCVNPKKQDYKGYTDSGTVTLTACRVEAHPSFVDYIRSGTEMSFVVAIDFSLSNCNTRISTSLHRDDREKPNLYYQAIKSVGEVIQHYDSDGMYPAFGFGAKPRDDPRSQAFFPINFHWANPNCSSIQGILDAYLSCLDRIKQIEPSNFAPLIKEVSNMASTIHDASKYFVLLLLTDGGISDLAKTKEAILRAAKLPVSIVIVGIGDRDFTAMNELDGDYTQLTHRGIPVERDIVQFLPFHDFLSRELKHVASPEKLAKEVLAEIPDQVVEYMKKKSYHPLS